MNTKKHLPLNGTRVERATQLLRAYKHPYRYEIINSLLMHGSLSAAELASYVNVKEHYILEQMEVLVQNSLVLLQKDEEGEYYEANESMLLRIKKCTQLLA